MTKTSRWLVPTAAAIAGLGAGIWAAKAGLLSVLGAAARQEPAFALPRLNGGVNVSPAGVGDSNAPVSGSAVTAAGDEIAREEESLVRLWLQFRKNGGKGDMAAVLNAFVRYSKTNPARAIGLAMKMEGDEAWRLVMDLVIKMPAAGGIVMDALLKNPQYWEPCPPMDAVFVCCARSDPERAWREATTPGRPFMPAALDAIARGWAEKDPRGAMEFSTQIGNAAQKSAFVRTILGEWSEHGGRSLIQWIGAQPDRTVLAEQVRWTSMRFDSMEEFLTMTKVVPPSLIDGTNPKARGANDAAEDGWVTRTDWLQALPQGETRTALFTGAARALAGSDPEKALALLPEIENTRIRNLTTSAVAAYRAAVSPEHGLAFADSLTDETARSSARMSALETWGASDPAAAARYAIASGGKQDVNLINHLGDRWSDLDPSGAVSFALENEQADPDAWFFGTLLGSAMNNWVKNDAFAASLWVTQMKAGVQKDRAMSALAQGAMRSEPDGAIGWAVSIADPTLRQQAVESCYQSWLSFDRTRAAAWLRHASIDATTKGRLATALQSVQQSGRSEGGWHSDEKITVVY